jgi:hypothetical protein
MGTVNRLIKRYKDAGWDVEYYSSQREDGKYLSFTPKR